MEPTFFEGTTVTTFLAFSETPADILILETGFGERLDYTNVVKNLYFTLITPISFDDMEHLGNTLEVIATEKLGIKQGVLCVISAQTDRVYDVLLSKYHEVKSRSFCYEYNYPHIVEKNRL